MCNKMITNYIIGIIIHIIGIIVRVISNKHGRKRTHVPSYNASATEIF